MKWIIAVLLLLLGSPILAQHRYWAADYDSLSQVLRHQPTDTARVRTIRHMLDVVELTELRRRQQVLPLLDTLFQLNARTRQLDEAPYRELQAGVRLWVGATRYPQALSALQQAIELFDAAGHPVPLLLIDLAPLYNAMHETAGRQAYFQRKLIQYRVERNVKNQAACYLVLGGTYRHRGDYNQAISCYLHAADLFKGFHRRLYANELMVAGTTYAEWGNDQKALYYLKQAAGLNQKYTVNGLQRFFGQQAVGKLYLQQGRLSEALRYAELLLETARLDSVDGAQFRAYGLVLKSQVLLALRQPQAVWPLLTRAQQIADSLHMPVTGRPGEFALDATWAHYYTARHNIAQADKHWRQ